MNYELLTVSEEVQKENLLKIFQNISVNELEINESKFTDFSFAGNIIEDKKLLRQYISGSIDPTTHVELVSKFGSVDSMMSNQINKRKRSKRRSPTKFKRVIQNSSKKIMSFFPRKEKSITEMRTSISQQVEINANLKVQNLLAEDTEQSGPSEKNYLCQTKKDEISMENFINVNKSKKISQAKSKPKFWFAKKKLEVTQSKVTPKTKDRFIHTDTTIEIGKASNLIINSLIENSE